MLTMSLPMAKKIPPPEKRFAVTHTIIVDGKPVTEMLETPANPTSPRVPRTQVIAQLDAMYSDDDPPIVTGNLNKRLRVF